MAPVPDPDREPSDCAAWGYGTIDDIHLEPFVPEGFTFKWPDLDSVLPESPPTPPPLPVPVRRFERDNDNIDDPDFLIRTRGAVIKSWQSKLYPEAQHDNVNSGANFPPFACRLHCCQYYGHDF